MGEEKTACMHKNISRKERKEQKKDSIVDVPNSQTHIFLPPLKEKKENTCGGEVESVK